MRDAHQSFAEELERVLVETDTSIRRLARLSGIPRRTLENWLYGDVRRPRYVEPILQMAQVLHLPAHDVDRVLVAAGHPSLNALKQGKKSVKPELLADWQLAPDKLMGQNSSSLAKQHNLPAASTPFLGRNKLCEELAGLIKRPDLRLVTVTGLGGAGKTRLALETARAVADWFDHGVYFIPLDNVSDADGFWEAIHAELNIPGDGLHSTEEIVKDYLQNKQILLLLDNFEHLLPLTTEISGLLSTTQRLNLLITSRHALNMKAEQLCAIGGLSCTEEQESPAFQLYMQSARRRVPNYQPSPRAVEDVIALCSQVDGLPLAIELAATWSDVLSPAQILSHLTKDLREVRHDAVDRPERQRSLWHLFDYTWQMLSPEEQEAAMRLGVLRGTFTPQAAIGIAECHPAVLKVLIQTSFVMGTSGSRLMIHRLARQFLIQQAEGNGYSVEALEERFMAYVLSWAAEESNQLAKTLVARHFQTLHAEWQHFERAWWLAVERRRYSLLESCIHMLFYFEARGNWGQGVAFYQSTRRQVPADARLLHATLDGAESWLATRLLDVPRAIELAQRSLSTLDEVDVDSKTHVIGAYARVSLFVVDYSFNQQAYGAEMRQKFREVAAGHLPLTADILGSQFEAAACFAKEDYAAASAIFRDALEMVGPDAYSVAILRCFLGLSLNKEGFEEQAREQFERALNRALEIKLYPAVEMATYELRLMQGDDPTTQQVRDVFDDLALRMGSRKTVGRVAIIVAAQYLNFFLLKKGSQLTRIGLGMLWKEVDTAERRQILSTVAQMFIAFGLIKHAPQVLSLLAPKTSS